MRKIIFLLLSISLFTSCTEVMEHNIKFSTIEKEVRKIEKNNPQLDSLKLHILNNLVLLTKGRETYRKKQDSITGFSIEIAESFDKDVKNLFNYFEESNVTYRQLLSEIDTVIMIENDYKERYGNMANEIKQTYEDQESKKEITYNSLTNLKIILNEEKAKKIADKTDILRIYYNLNFIGL